MALQTFPSSLAPSHAAFQLAVCDLGPEADTRQYQHVLSVATSQQHRLAIHGALRRNPGYDDTDDFLDDSRNEQLIPGFPCQLVGTGQFVAYLGIVEADVQHESVSSSNVGICQAKLLDSGSIVSVQRSSLMPLPTCPPRQGDWVVAVDLPTDQQFLLGRRAMFTHVVSEAGEAKAWVAFEASEGPPQVMKLLARNLVALPVPSPGTHITPFDAKIMPLGLDPEAASDLVWEPPQILAACVDDSESSTSFESDSTEIVPGDENLSVGDYVTQVGGAIGHRVGIMEDMSQDCAVVRWLSPPCNESVRLNSLAPITEKKIIREASCGKCGRANRSANMLLCKHFSNFCLGAVHLECLPTSLTQISKKAWVCANCTSRAPEKAKAAANAQRKADAKADASSMRSAKTKLKPREISAEEKPLKMRQNIRLERKIDSPLDTETFQENELGVAFQTTAAEAVQVINGIQYPRDVPVPEGVPEGWRAVEHAYGPNSKSAGKTYVRYSSADGRHKQLRSPKAVLEIHCAENNLDFATEYAKYESAVASAKDEKRKIAKAQREAKGKAVGQRREDLIALSKARYGDLTGPIVLGFTGWKCRWDWLIDSQQAPKTFMAPDGREWKLLKDVECMLGMNIELAQPDLVKQDNMVEAGKNNLVAQNLFSTGAERCRETQSSIIIDPAEEQVMETERKTCVKSKKHYKDDEYFAKIRRVMPSDYGDEFTR